MSIKTNTRVRNSGSSENKLSKIIIKQEQGVHTLLNQVNQLDKVLSYAYY